MPDKKTTAVIIDNSHHGEPLPPLLKGKRAQNSDAAWDIQDQRKGQPHGWIQWKGTGVCMDVHCACGHRSHIDAEFAYHVECPKCHRVYMCNGHIELIELDERPAQCVVMDDGENDNGD